MNLNQNPTPNELRSLIADCNDRAGHHVLWIGKDGEVHLTQIPKGKSPTSFEDDPSQMQIRFETFEVGNGYVGFEAAQDDEWVTALFRSLVESWPNAKGKKNIEHANLEDVFVFAGSQER